MPPDQHNECAMSQKVAILQPLADAPVRSLMLHQDDLD